MKKLICAILLMSAMAVCLAGCEGTPKTKEEIQIQAAQNVAGGIVENQPVPTDIEYSLERYNVIKRAYWVNGQREKAMSLPCAANRPLGYIVLFTDSGAVAGSFVVDGKVSSLNSYLFPAYEQEYYYANGAVIEREVAGIDGTYGENVSGIFFFTTDGDYVEWTGKFLYTDIPVEVDAPVLKYEVTK